MAVSPCISKADPRGRELVRHGTVLFPAACYHDDLTRDAIPWHWHTELEAGIVTEGTAVVAAGTERFVLERGMGFFITSGVLHTVLTRGGPECRLHSAVFHPRLVGSGADSIFWQNYIQPLLAEDAPKCVLLDGGEPWHSEALRAIAAAWDACAEELPGYDLRMRENLSQLAFLLCRHRPAERKPLPAKALRDEARMKRMLGFIQDHYAEEIGAAAIAQSAAVSESECLRCFRAAIGVPPTQYLKQFRVHKAAELLASTAWSAAEVGARCGFQDASYFAKTFRQLKGRTPSEYRREHASG